MIGPWSTEEESLLSKIVETMIKDSTSSISWSSVSQQMGNIRTAKQCKEKWCVEAFVLFIDLQLTLAATLGPILLACSTRPQERDLLGLREMSIR